MGPRDASSVSYISKKISLSISLHLPALLSFQYGRRTRSCWTPWTETFPCPRTSRRLPKTWWILPGENGIAGPSISIRFSHVTRSPRLTRSHDDTFHDDGQRRSGINVANAFSLYGDVRAIQGRNSETTVREKSTGLRSAARWLGVTRHFNATLQRRVPVNIRRTCMSRKVRSRHTMSHSRLYCRRVGIHIYFVSNAE